MSHPGDLLSAYFDDELDVEGRAAVAAHLEACDPCRAELAEIESAAVAVRSLPMLDPGLALTPATPRWRRSWRWPALGAAAVGAAALAAVVVGVAIFGDDDDAPGVAAMDTVPVELAGMDAVPAGDHAVSGEQRVQALDAALRTMGEVEDTDMATDDMTVDVEVMMGDEPLKVTAGMWDGVAADYAPGMAPAAGVVGLYVAAEGGVPMTFFFCEHSWYRVETASGRAPSLDMVASLRGALGCS